MAEVTTQRLKKHPSVGTDTRKVDGREKLKGEAIYISDFDDDDLLHAAIVRSNRPHAKILSVDTSEAEELTGVYCAVSRMDLMGGFDDRIRHYGDVIAAVAAEDPSTAKRAANAISFKLEALEPTTDAREAIRAEAPTVQEEQPVGLRLHQPHEFTVERDEYEKNIDDYHLFELGDTETALENADVVHRDTYRTPRVNHCNLDSHCCVAEWDDDHLTIVETLTSPHPGKESVAGFLGIDADQMTISMPQAGSSSFGGQALPKLTLEPVAATLARETDRPVKLWFDREEDFIATETRHPVYFEVSMGATADGELVAIDIDAVADTGAYPNGVGHIVLANCQDRVMEIYDVPNYRFEGVSVFTNNVVAGEYRGIGSTQLGFALDSHVDELCRQAGFDPIEFRRTNFIEEGACPPHLDAPINSCGLAECLDRGLERFKQHQQGPTDSDLLYGWGFAAATHTTGAVKPGPDHAEVKIELSANGTGEITATAIDQGQGSDTALVQIVSNESGIETSQLTVETPSTDQDIEGDLGSIASRTTWMVGSAAKNASKNLHVELTERLGDEIERIDGDTVVPVSGSPKSLDELLSDTDDSITVRGTFESTLRPPGYGVHFVELNVDPDTGKVDIQTYVAAQDIGFAINQALVEGQLEGAILHGVESALFSELKLENGNPQNANLADYPVISPWEMPDTTICELIESNEESGPYGAKGVGTPSMPPIAPAITNALRDAAETRFTELPVDMETIFDAVGGENE